LREARRRALTSAIEAARRRARRKIEAIDGDLGKIDAAEGWQLQATLLLGVAHSIPRGATSATVEDWSTGEPVAISIPLDPAKTARETADALFHRAKRLKKGRAIAEERRAVATRALEALDALHAAVVAAEDDRALEIARSRGEALGVRIAPAARRARAEPEERRPYNLYRSGDRAIYVGRGAKDNDTLTTKIAKPHDVWLHAKDRNGAHVVVPLAKGESIPSELLIDAAHLAAHHSDARGEAVVEVQWTPRRYLRKPKGAAAGAVIVDREKVIVLRVEPARLERLQSTVERT
jgi:predicted ribosome quality control (RQC) complex YloA/Tae2 family protein